MGCGKKLVLSLRRIRMLWHAILDLDKLIVDVTTLKIAEKSALPMT